MKILKISPQDVNFITRAMVNWRVELAAGQTLAEVKIQRDIFLRDSLSPLLFIIAIMLINYLLRKYKGGYKFTKSLQKINRLVYTDDIKIFSMNKKGIEILLQTIRIYSQDIGMEFGIEKYAMLTIKKEKRKRKNRRKNNRLIRKVSKHLK